MAYRIGRRWRSYFVDQPDELYNADNSPLAMHTATVGEGALRSRPAVW